MKKFLFILAATVSFGAAQAQTQPDAMAKFETDVHDFGKIKQGVPVHTDFYFTNITKAPITVASATASCGCTTPTKPEQPILPGKRDKINAGYNAANLGAFEKTIYVTFEGAGSPKELKIKGEVVAADAVTEPAPPVEPAIVKQEAPAPVPAKTTAKTTTRKTTTKRKTVRS